MSLGKILVPLDGSDQDRNSLITAIRAAKPFNAHVAAVYAHGNPEEALSKIAVPLTSQAFAAVIDANIRIFRAKAGKIREMIAQVAAEEGAREVPSPCRGNAVTVSFHELAGHVPDVIGGASALADLVVFRPSAGEPHLFETSIELILHQRRPVLVAKDPPSAFRTIAIGWNNTTVAADAVAGAMDFLEKADVVKLVCVEQAAGPSCATGNILAYLKAHGIAASEVHFGAWDTKPRTTLSDLVLEEEADLLVTGAFGHSRVRETIFGGVTNEILHGLPIPVLLTH